MPFTRRTFLKAGTAAAAMMAVPRPLLAHLESRPELAPVIDDPRLKALAERALESARTAGADYADVRLTHTRHRGITPYRIDDSEDLAVGARALVNGYWGFAASPAWSPNEMARLGREAVNQAKTNALGKPRTVALAPVPTVASGHWVMPVAADPFEIYPVEIQDFLAALEIYTKRTPGAVIESNRCFLFVQEKAFGSTDGGYCTQRLYRTSGSLAIALRKDGKQGLGALDLLSPAGVGWELYRNQPLREAIRRLIAEIEEDLALPVKPVEVGRYDTVLDTWSVANLVDETLGRATELDRALGYEANAGGTSYLNDPFAMLGTYQVGAPLITVTASRREPGGAATVQWDDEGVTPDEFSLIEDGVLVDFQTTRESAGWLAESYAKTGQSVRSHGCAAAPSAMEPALQRAPNLTLAPGADALDFDGLVADVSDGIAIKGLNLRMDFQGLNGLGTGRAYEVKKGKRVARLANAGLLFRAPELWKGLLALGGAASARRFGGSTTKGEPAETTVHSVTAVPAAFKQLTTIDPQRKA